MENTYTPCCITGDAGCEVSEVGPVCGLTKEAAIDYARSVYGDDAGIINDAEQWAEWIGVERPTDCDRFSVEGR